MIKSSSIELFKDSNLSFILTDRHGGVSLSPYESMNLAYHVGDRADDVKRNRDIVMESFPKKTLLYLNQIHSNTIISVKKDSYATYSNAEKIGENDRNFRDSEIMLGDGDGFICNDSSVACIVRVADCNPILLYYQKSGVVAQLHAGRVGLYNNIIKNCLDIMAFEYGISQEDLWVFVGASIRKCCYEIGRDLASSFKDFVDIRKNAYYLDMLPLILRDIKHVAHKEILHTCTCCDSNYFSYRRERNTGRFALIATLEN